MLLANLNPSWLTETLLIAIVTIIIKAVPDWGRWLDSRKSQKLPVIKSGKDQQATLYAQSSRRIHWWDRFVFIFDCATVVLGFLVLWREMQSTAPATVGSVSFIVFAGVCIVISTLRNSR